MQAQLTPSRATANRRLPYPPSWVDLQQAWVERLPWPASLSYVLAWLVVVGVETLLKWWDGTYPPGTFSPFHLVFAGTGVYILALVHYLDGAASRALDALRPVLALDDEAVETLRYRLTTLPARGALGATAFGLVWALVIRFVFIPPYLSLLEFATSTPTRIYEPLLLAFTWVAAGAFIYHTMRQLRLIDRLHRTCVQVNLFHVGPLYAFSKFSARSAVGILLLGYAWLATAPNGFSVPLLLINVALLAGISLLTFVWPLWGVHSRLESEKGQRKAQVNARLEGVLAQLHDHVDKGEYSATDAVNNAVSGLTAELALLSKVSTWPWQTSTLRGLLTAVFLPLFLWAAERVLGLWLLP